MFCGDLRSTLPLQLSRVEYVLTKKRCQSLQSRPPKTAISMLLAPWALFFHACFNSSSYIFTMIILSNYTQRAQIRLQRPVQASSLNRESRIVKHHALKLRYAISSRTI